MKVLKKTALLLIALITYTSCNYLDIVPDEMDREENAFEDPNAALRYIYSCYSYLPQENQSGAIDMLTSDEIVTPFENEVFAIFLWGNYTSTSPVISYWNTLYSGLRQCHIFLKNVDKVPGLSTQLRNDYAAQAKFLIGYYHYLLIRCYGPIILIKGDESISTLPENYAARSPLDECIEYACQMLDEAVTDLPTVRPTIYEYGLATSVAAKAVKAKMLLYAASPLFNGNTEFYANFKNKDNQVLMPLEYDLKKWDNARTAMEEAIIAAKDAGHDLYMTDNYNSNLNPYPEDPIQHRLRYTMLDRGNKEILLAETRPEGLYDLQNKTMPNGYYAWNGIAPTWTMLNRFYTKNGLPYDEDPSFKDNNKLEIVTVDASRSVQAKPGQRTILFNLDREPRYYAWVAFQGGYYELMSATNNGSYTPDKGYENGRLICDFVVGGNCSRGESMQSLRANNYSPSGYLSKKGIDPTNAVGGSRTYPNSYPWPVIRLADLYLGYAEACVETNDLDNAKIYLNKVRTRAGIPTVEDSWKNVATLDQNKLRQIVRQERLIEFFLEKQNFWDLRRWKIAEEYYGTKVKGLNVNATTIENFAQVVTLDFERNFQSPMNYLMPIPIDELNKNENLVNKPGY